MVKFFISILFEYFLIYFNFLDFMGRVTLTFQDLIASMTQSLSRTYHNWLPVQKRSKRDSISGELKIWVSVPKENLSKIAEKKGMKLLISQVERVKLVNNIDAQIFSKLKPEEKQKQQIIYEFIQTESQYIEDLTIVRDTMIKPLKEQGILTQEEIDKIFLNIEQILAINSKFLKSLLVGFSYLSFPSFRYCVPFLPLGRPALAFF